MKNSVFFLALFFSTGNILIAQTIVLNDANIAVIVKNTSFSNNFTELTIKNTSNNNILICLVDSAKFTTQYFGLGLFSSVFPFLPIHMKKYSGELKTVTINPDESLKFSLNQKFNIFDGGSIRIDYAIQSKKGTNSELILREEYEKNMIFLEFMYTP